MLQDLVRTIINTRDFCGNERAAAKQVFDDHGKAFDEELYLDAQMEANAEWNHYRKAARRAARK